MDPETCLNRRDLMRRLLQSAAGVSLAPAVHGRPQHAHGDAQKSSAGGDQEWRPQFFNAEQNRTLVSLGERIVPGSGDAMCNRLIDRFMTVESPERRAPLVSALAAFDRESRNRHGKPYSELSSEQQDELLTAASTGEQDRAHFQVIKEWIADAYWTSQEGMRELGRTNRIAWESFPGCEGAGPGS